MPKISVCIATYNRRDYLKETLLSINEQSFKDYEIVVLDDGSTDKTEEMIRTLDFPVRYYWQNNSGEPIARNRLVELAEGELITFIDSDDLFYPYSLGVLYDALECNGYDKIAYSSYTGIDEAGLVVPRKQKKQPSGSIVAALFEHIYVHSCGTLCRKDILGEVGGFDASLPVCSPYLTWLELSLTHEFVAVVEPTFKRRRHSDNLSVPSFENRLIELNVLEDFYYEKGGREVVPEKIAMRRLAKEEYRAAKSAFREGLFAEAYEYFRRSFKTCPQIKSLVYLIGSGIMKHMKR